MTIPHPSYSPDLARRDYHLYRSLSNYLTEKKLKDEGQIKIDLLNFVDQKTEDFDENGIVSLAERWRQVIDSNRAYILHWELSSSIRKKKNKI